MTGMTRLVQAVCLVFLRTHRQRRSIACMKTAASPGLPAFFPAQAFTLPGILPPHTCLLLDLQACTAILLHLNEGAGAPLVCSSHLAPSAARVFLALLQSYPQYCDYQRLFTMLYSAVAPERRPFWDPEIGLRPIRRALFALSPALAFFGLEIVALRRRGYLLAARTDTAETLPMPVWHDPSQQQAAS